jgi:hypothetical protein
MTREQAFQLINEVTNNDWENRKVTLSKVIEFANRIMIKRADSCPFFKTEREKLSNLLVQKVILHGASILSLVDGINLQTMHFEKSKIKDPISMQVIFRGLLESYLTLNHLNFSSESENEIRFKIWIQYGLRQREKVTFSIIPVEEFNLLKDERELINRLINEIKSSSFFDLLESDKKIKFLDQIERDWKIGFKNNSYLKFSWQQLLEKTGVNKELFSDTYNYLSWFAHSNCISLYQLDEMYRFKRDEQEVINLMKESSVFIVFALTDLIKIDEELLKQYHFIDQIDKDLINVYNFIFRTNNYTIESIED